MAAVPSGAAPVISEFLAVNHGPEFDDQGLTSDWIEIRNSGPGTIDLAGWTLTDEADTPGKWVFPQVSLNEGGLLVVRASGLDLRNPQQTLHTNFSLSGNGGFLGLYSPQGTPSTVWDPYPKQFTGFSYGTVSGGSSQGYFSTPTPLADNPSTALSDFVRDTHFSVERGFFTSPFTVEISVSTPGAVIRYTLDGSIPGDTTGTLYTGPVPVNTTTVLRARAFKSGLLPSNTDTQTYVFATTWKSQPDRPAGFPVTWGQTTFFGMPFNIFGDYGMSTVVTNHATYGPLIIPALTQTLPVLCITGSVAELFSDSGIQGNARNTDTEVAVAVEYFNPAAATDRFTTRATLQMHGAAIRQFSKKGFRIDFTGDFAGGTLHYPLFPGSPVESFDQLVLRPGGHDSFTSQGRGGPPDNNDLSFHASYLRDQFLRRTENEIGLVSPRGRYVHLCLNGLYWGVYDLHERPNAEMMAFHGGGAPTEWDVLHHPESAGLGPQVIDGTDTAWWELQGLTVAPVTDDNTYRDVVALLGPDRFIDHLLVRMWAGDHDWLGPANMPGVTGSVSKYNDKNWYAARNSRAPAASPWQFFTWDAEISMGNHLLFHFIDTAGVTPPEGFTFPHLREVNLDLTGINFQGTPAQPWAALTAHPEFRLKVADRAQRLLLHNGKLSAPVAAARLSALIQELDLAIVAESARWGGDAYFERANIGGILYMAWINAPLLRDTHWRSEVGWLRDTFCAARAGILLNQLRARDLYPSTEPVDVSPFGGFVGEADTITLTAAAGTIHYTLDGTDPRAPFTGFVQAGALTYSAPFTPPSGGGPFTLKARALSGNNWSALTEVLFTSAVPPTPAALALTEIHYHPGVPSATEATAGFTDADDFEFLEITNVSQQRVSLTGLRFSAGIDYDFSTDSSVQELAPGASLVLASNRDAFQLRYGFVPAGVFANGSRLSNSGETIKIVTAAGVTIVEVTYNDRDGWPEEADGSGRSLVLMAPLSGTEEGDSDHWRASTETGGNPGTVGGNLTFAVWLGDYFTPAEIADPLVTGPLSNPEGDGMSNLTEYATRTNPLKASQNPVRVAILPEGGARFTWERRADTADITGELELSSSLQSWQSTGAGITVSNANTTRGTVLQTVDCTAASGIRFARLKITLAP